MELNSCSENVCVNEIVYNNVLEQPVELDYMLPDYCPNVFKVLKCNICTKIIAQNIVGSKLTIDGIAIIKILYVSEDTGKLRQIEQKQAFTKTLELKENCDGRMANITAKCDYVNCRAVNQRRLDIRGAVSLRVTVSKMQEKPMMCDCENIQLHKHEMTVCRKTLSVTKEFTVKEELQIGHGSQPMQDILNYEATAVMSEYKLLANKVICKGEVFLHTLYLCSNNPDKPEVVEHSIPISQIVDFDGIDEDFTCCNTIEIVKYDIDMQIEDDGECHSFVAQITLRICCEASQNRTISLIDDCYSTGYETNVITEKMKFTKLNKAIHENTMVKNNIRLNQSELSSIFDILYEVNSVSWRVEEGKVLLSCNLQLSILAVSEENIPVCVEQNMPCEISCDAIVGESLQFEPTVRAISLGFAIVSIEELEVRAELRIDGLLYEVSYCDVTTSIEVREDQPKQRKDDCALRLYFADAGENIWEIAKKYGTSVQVILEQNSIEAEVIAQREMILIPIVD